MFEGMTPAEDAFFERIKNAPAEQAQHFRDMFNLLMGAYGENPPNSIALIVHERNETLSVHALNADGPNTAIMMATGLDSVMSSLSEKERMAVLAVLVAMQGEETPRTVQ